MPELPDPLYVTNEAAALLRSNPRTLERWRTTGEGPTFVKLGRRVAYRLSDLQGFVEGRTRQHTADRARALDILRDIGA